ncbi:glycosyltransferase family 4 protein, partial [Methanoregula sp.]|uniref:glycosyltransferase family 4 protein n=1 Tax=Methanoregula sp. TaxID=2052170 RepID=UPI003C7969DC
EFPPFFRGGLGTYAGEISGVFIRKGHSLSVFSRNTGSDPTSENLSGIDVHRPNLMKFSDILSIINPDEIKTWDENGQEFFAETLQYNLLSSSKLVNQLVAKEHRRYDLLVSHDWLAALAGIMAKRNLGIPWVFHFHSTEQGRNPTGSPTIKDIERLSATIADRIVTVSYAMRDELVSFGYPVQKIRVVHNGVDEKKYDPVRYSRQEIETFRDKIGVGNAPMILFIGRLTWVKGVDNLVRAMPAIIREIPDAKLVILGLGEMDRMLEHIVHNLHLEKNVILHFKMAPEEERLLYYAAADVVVLPSKYEPFGIVCTEAMSMGKPVVVGARGTSGFREQVIPAGDEICGYHINPGDPQDIATFTVDILKKPDLAETMGKNGRLRVIEHFTWEIASENTIRVYSELVGRT